MLDWSSVAIDILSGHVTYVYGRMCGKTFNIQQALQKTIDNLLNNMHNVRYIALVDPDPKFRRPYAIHFDQYLRRN